MTLPIKNPLLDSQLCLTFTNHFRLGASKVLSLLVLKFKDMKDFGTFKKGKISLQDHGEDVWFKNIKIKKL